MLYTIVKNIFYLVFHRLRDTLFYLKSEISRCTIQPVNYDFNTIIVASMLCYQANQEVGN